VFHFLKGMRLQHVPLSACETRGALSCRDVGGGGHDVGGSGGG